MNGQPWQEIEVDESFRADLRGWLVMRMTVDRGWLLVHADDGVIWGRREPDGSLRLSSDVFDMKSQYPAIAVDLRADTLQQARIFGPAGELLAWRDGAGFRARAIADGEARPATALGDADETHLLWGLGKKRVVKDGFTLLAEGVQGPQHAVPIVIEGRRRPALKVRHYVNYDDEGQAYVELSRLVDLQAA